MGGRVEVRQAALETPFQRRLLRFRHRHTEAIVGIIFISPFIISFLWFEAYPIFASLYYGFTDYNIMQSPVFVGLSNYVRLFTQDSLFVKSLVNTIVYTVFSVPIDLAVAFLFALLLNTKVPGRPIFRTLFYLPAILPSVAVSILWIMLLNSQGGVVDVALQAVHLPAIPWLTSPSWALWSLILLSVWGIGPMVVIFLAGLQDVPKELYEAARIDGARGPRVVQHVTIPMISPVILFNLIIGMISALQVFAQPFIIFSGSTNAGGGPLNSALMYSVQLYFVAFQQFQMGYASAMAWVLFVIVMAMSLAALLVSRWLVHYE